MSSALRTLRRRAVLAWALLGAACGSGPGLTRVVTIADGEAVQVSYQQQRTGLRQTLLTEGIAPARDFYSSRSSDPLAKVMSTEQMQVLLDALATHGFFDRARPIDAGAAVSSIEVRLADRSLVWAKHGSMNAAELDAYHQAMAAFLNIYNATESFHSAGEDSLLEEAERIRRRNEDALRRASNVDRGQGKP